MPNLKRGQQNKLALRKLVMETVRLFWHWKIWSQCHGYDCYQVDVIDPEKSLLLHSQLKAPGEGLDGMARRSARGTRLMQTVYFTPHGFGGFMYWFLFMPIHRVVFCGLIKKIAAHSVVK
ncbi:MAG: DUF2867 domain-containing protein [Anaerolineales bacterium]|nr:DUF2867 domain-containing protein [Anaerolineales bacterium]